MKRLILSLLLLLTSIGAPMAAKVLIGNLWYAFSGTTATVADAQETIVECEIPSTVTYNDTVYTVTAIGEKAFYACKKLESITIPNSVTKIGKNAFANCSVLLEVSIPDGVTSIEQSTFDCCYALSSVTIPNTVRSIGYRAFCYCRALSSITIPENVTTIGGYAFNSCESMLSLTIPNSVKVIGESAFSGCDKVTSISIPGSVTSIGEYAFSSCERLNTVSISYGVTSIGDYAFYYCPKLSSVTIPNSVTSIGEGAFWSSSGLTSITIPSSVTSIGERAFSSKNLESVYCLGDNPPVCGENAFPTTILSTCTLYVSEEGEPFYRTADIWKDFSNIVVMDSSDPSVACAAPTIAFDAETKQLKIESATEGAQCYYTITSDDFVNDKLCSDGVAQLTGVYTITAYAAADGKYNSERATAQLLWVNAADVDTGVFTAQTQRGVVVTTADGAIYISGTVGGEPIEVYDVSGTKQKDVQATAGKTVITGLPTNTVYVVKIAGNSVKVAL